MPKAHPRHPRRALPGGAAVSEHSTEELKRQLDNAKSRLGQAREAAAAARTRYEARLLEEKLADYAARGITPGCKVLAIAMGRYGVPNKETPATFLGVEFGWTGEPAPILGALKADGSPSKARRRISFDRIEPAKTAPQIAALDETIAKLRKGGRTHG